MNAAVFWVIPIIRDGVAASDYVGPEREGFFSQAAGCGEFGYLDRRPEMIGSGTESVLTTGIGAGIQPIPRSLRRQITFVPPEPFIEHSSKGIRLAP
jgi:hypothetical protein